MDVVCAEYCFLLEAGFLRRLCDCYRKQIPRKRRVTVATGEITFQAIVLYILVVFMVGLNIPYNDKNLRDASISSIRQGQNSHPIIAYIRNGVLSSLHFFNAFFIFAFLSTANDSYIFSRLLHALASNGNIWLARSQASSIKIRLEKASSKRMPVDAIFSSRYLAYWGFSQSSHHQPEYELLR